NQTTALLRQQLLNKTYDGGIALVSRIGTGNLVSTLLDGMDEISNYLSLIFPKLIALAIVPWMILIYIFTLNALSVWILLFVFLYLYLYSILSFLMDFTLSFSFTDFIYDYFRNCCSK